MSQALEDCAREEIEDPGFVLEVKLLLPTYQTWIMSCTCSTCCFVAQARLELEWRSAVGWL